MAAASLLRRQCDMDMREPADDADPIKAVPENYAGLNLSTRPVEIVQKKLVRIEQGFVWLARHHPGEHLIRILQPEQAMPFLIDGCVDFKLNRRKKQHEPLSPSCSGGQRSRRCRTSSTRT